MGIVGFFTFIMINIILYFSQSKLLLIVRCNIILVTTKKQKYSAAKQWYNAYFEMIKRALLFNYKPLKIICWSIPQLYVLNLHAQSWTPNLPLKPPAFIYWFTSNPHTVFSISVDGIFILSVTQAKNVGIKSTLLFLMSHIQYPSGNPEGCIFKIIFKVQPLFTISTAALLIPALMSLILIILIDSSLVSPLPAFLFHNLSSVDQT